jgi:hypothetical protein
MIRRSVLLRTSNTPHKSCRENQNTPLHVQQFFFQKNRALCDIMWKNTVQLDNLLLLLQSALQPLLGFRPAQLSLNILSRKVFTECRCQRHVKPPTWRRTSDLERSNFRHKRPPASEATLTNPAAEDGTMGEKWPRNFSRKWRHPRHFWICI